MNACRRQGDSRPRVLIVGQTPPPYMGQALMIRDLVQAHFTRIQTFHVRMHFSDSMSEMGRVSTKKMLHLGSVVRLALQLRHRYQIPLLYYPPAGPTAAAVVRDMVILSALRPFFSKVVFHFHGTGLSDYLEYTSPVFRKLAKAVYGRPDAAIQPSALASSDGEYVGAREIIFIPNGLADSALPYLNRRRTAEDKVRVLFVGGISEMKGAMLLLKAAQELNARRSDFTVWMMGQFISDAYERQVRAFCRDNGLEQVVTFLGLCVDDDKWRYFRRANILCLPSLLESFGNVLVEAMMFELPVVATRVGGVPDIVEPGRTGILLADHSSMELAAALESLITDASLRRSMGVQGRCRYLERFTLDTHLRRMETCLYEVSRS
jgi:glycosyltransferase involved in cell wall biosynthesis